MHSDPDVFARITPKVYNWIRKISPHAKNTNCQELKFQVTSSTTGYGSKCGNSFMGQRCSPCGRGTRCRFCTWCIVMHSSAAGRSATTNMVSLPYKQPFLNMFEDIQTRIANDFYDNKEIIAIFGETSEALKEDYKNCGECSEVSSLSNYTSYALENLKDLEKQQPSSFKMSALSRSMEITRLLNEMPEDFVSFVEHSSELLIPKN